MFQQEYAKKCSAEPKDPGGVIIEPAVDWETENGKSKAKFKESDIPGRRVSKLRYVDVLKARAKIVEAQLPRDIDMITSQRITAAEVFQSIQMHPKTDCPDPDGISLVALQAIPYGKFHQYLADWFTDCARRKDVPNSWKRGLITPVYKGKGKPEGQAPSYRPVSITSYLSRTWERIVLMRMEDRLARLHNGQFGFLRGRTGEQLLGHIRRTLRRTTGVLDTKTSKHFVAAGISFDCTDAFCKIGPSTVAAAMRRIGIDETTIAMVTSWLTGREQAVKLEDYVTEYLPVATGLPQGSVLGPILWVIVMDDLLCRLSKTSKKHLVGCIPSACLLGAFADDLTLIVGARTADDAARSLKAWSTEAVRWFHQLDIPISTKTKASFFTHAKSQIPKTKTIRLSSDVPGCSPVSLDITNDGLQILGVWFSPDGTCYKHLQTLRDHLETIQQDLHVISRYMHPKTVREIYLQQGLSKLRYGATATIVDHHPTQEQEGHCDAIFGANTKWTEAQKDRCAELWKELEQEHQECCRIIVGAHPSSKLELCRALAGIPPLLQLLKEHAARSNAKLAARPAVDVGGLICGKRTSILLGVPELPNNQPELLCLPYHPADGALAATQVHIHSQGQPKTPKSHLRRGKENYPPEAKAEYQRINEQRTLAALESLGGSATFTLATDASIAEERRDHYPKGSKFVGSSSLIWSQEELIAGLLYHKHGVATTPSTYTVEGFAGVTGLLRVTEELRRRGTRGATVLWKTDSRSIVDAVASGPLSQRELFSASIWKELVELVALGARIAIVHVLSHAGDVENEAADYSASSQDIGEVYVTDAFPLTALDVASNIARELRQSTRTAWKAEHGSDLRFENVDPAELRSISSEMTRADTRELMRLRVGVSKALGGDKHGVNVDCYHCGEVGVLSRGNKAVQHMFSCRAAAVAALRDRHFGADAGRLDLGTLWTAPAQSVKYARDFWSSAPHSVRSGTRQVVPLN